MKILFDIISLQGFVNGGAEYARRILFELVERCRLNYSFEIIGLYDPSIQFVEIYNVVGYLKENNIRMIDIQQYNSISKIIRDENIDCFFIAIAQRYLKYNIDNIRCRTVMVIHDVFDYEIKDNCLSLYLSYCYGSVNDKIKNLIKILFFPRYGQRDYSNIISLYNQKNVSAVTVSEYTKESLMYYFPQLLDKRISVLYSPQKIANKTLIIQNKELLGLINSKIKYYLIVSANRLLKNADFVISTFQKICAVNRDIYLVTVGSDKSFFKNHIALPQLLSSDLEYAYQNAYSLIFASLEEGFGYPPLEAMKYGVPVICSNVCSMPELLEDSCLYFSPLYKNDLFSKVMKMERNRNYYAGLSMAKSDSIKKRQEQDVNVLCDMILNF